MATFFVAYIAHFEHSACGHRNFEITKSIGGHTDAFNPFLNYTCADDGLVVLIQDGTADNGIRLTLHLGLRCSVCSGESHYRKTGHQEQGHVQMFSHIN